MPAETTYAIIGTIAAFGALMAVLAWGYWYTGAGRDPAPGSKR